MKRKRSRRRAGELSTETRRVGHVGATAGQRDHATMQADIVINPSMMLIRTLGVEIVVNVVLSYKVEMRLKIKHGLIYGIYSGK